ncbi:MAG: 2-C-methyl-D-erythritol 4-phosphate cytidylyltransferase [Atopobiaceae bacterium]|nr:2-C-methyl-D-erythritol 4-phosphate cytidylyltransferase [Atopobiaceae bacterium]
MAAKETGDAGMRVEAVIFAGGVGRRMGGSRRPKQFLELGGRPIIDYTIEHFANHPLVSRVVVSCLEDWIPYLQRVLKARRHAARIDVVPGGDSGQASIFNGLQALHDEHPGEQDAVVLVHDGVRPLIDEETITACVRSVCERGSTATVAPAIETIVLTKGQGVVSEIIPRADVGLARAPQAFRLEALYGAHVRAKQEGLEEFIDSVSMMSHFGDVIYTVEGPVENIKVTTPMDYYAFKGYMEARDQRMLWSTE